METPSEILLLPRGSVRLSSLTHRIDPAEHTHVVLSSQQSSDKYREISPISTKRVNRQGDYNLLSAHLACDFPEFPSP
jgi:hypothetical protein